VYEREIIWIPMKCYFSCSDFDNT